MCRVLAYTGPSARVSDLLYRTDNALVRQSYEPQLLHMLNLGGFGMMAWDALSPEPAVPLAYRSADLPIFDSNLRSIAEKFRTTCLLAHIRGIAYRADAGFGPHNLHPFHFTGERWAMAHNGDLADHTRIKHELLETVDHSLRRQIQGTTDSETVYAMVLAALREQSGDGPQALVHAVRQTLSRIREVRARHGIDHSSSLNLFFSDGRAIVGLRYCFDFGNYPLDIDPADFNQGSTRYLSLWYTEGGVLLEDENASAVTNASRSDGAVIVASEPLTRDPTAWVEVPEYTFLIADPDREEVSMVEV